MADKNNRDNFPINEMTEYMELQKKVFDDSNLLLPMLDDEAKALFMRIHINQTKMTRVATNAAFIAGADFAAYVIEDSEEE